MESREAGAVAEYADDGQAPNRVPIVDYLVLGEEPYLQAHECDRCGALYFDRRNACARCFATVFRPRRLAAVGTIRAYTIVYRAAPSLPVPYTSVVVDLDGGGSVKANLLDITDPAQITAGQRVALHTFTFGKDDDGVEAVSFGFRKMEGSVE